MYSSIRNQDQDTSKGRRQKTAMTAQETLDKGAIEMPTTGVKAAGKKCLTCISQGGGCPELQWWGSSVNPAAALGNRKARHATRGRAQAFNDTIINIRNTVWFKAFPDYQKEEALAAAAQAMAKEESGDQAEEEANASPSANLLRDTIFDLPHDISGRPGREFILMVEIAQRTIDMVGGNTIPNRDTIVAEAQRQRQAAAFNPTDFETRVQAVKVYVTVVTHLYNTVGLTAADVQSFLPVGHPGNDDMRLRKKASHKACQVRWRVNRDAVLWSMKGGQIIC